ncbi:MAG: type II toxin-antitoxin system VapC family toxin [Chloroflexi bacterium]|nr:type II toxin-antitoxin system VapC family toxin [Chloroflexota bacterium]MYF65446.1 type II toxin-antitoxin system VapC family toxin [Chloroflexota bacterium]MYK35310.1 type II toxin-antitoxin system VapC family toxin [Chloroflexota bacterium]
MDLVIDTSAIIAVIAYEPEREAIIEHTVRANLMAPASVHWEVGNAFSGMFKRHRISLSQAEQAIRSYERMQFRFLDVDLGQSVRLAHELGLYAYDAYVLACALNVRSPLLTLDSELATNADAAGVRILEVQP